MKLNVCFLFVLLGVIQAGPAGKVTEKKSLVEKTELETPKENLKIEEAGEDKDRSKKAALCLQIEPGTSQPAPLALSENQFVQNIPLAQSIPQQLLVQPVSQPLSQANIVLPQQVVQPIHTLQIVQSSAQPCPQPTPTIIQSTPQTAPQRLPKPKPKPTSAAEPEPITEPMPTRTEVFPQPLPEPQETLSVVPFVPACPEHIMMVPEPEPTTFIQVPAVSGCTNPLHGLLTECTCQKIEPMPVSVMPIMSYPAAYAKPQVVIPHMHAKVGPHARTSTHVHINTGYNHLHPHLQKQTLIEKTLVRGLPTQYASGQLFDSSYTAKGININAFPQTYNGLNSLLQPAYRYPGTVLSRRNMLVAPEQSEVYDLMPTSKAPRETDSNQLSPMKAEETKQEEDGRRNARSNKEESKIEKKQLTQN